MAPATLQIPCPGCGARNRVVAARLPDAPVCGRCRAPLFPREPVALDADAFDRLGAQSDLPLVVDFWAPWCAPCRTMAPQFAAAAAEMGGRVVFGKLDTERYPALAAAHRVQSIPTLALFRHGRELARVTGVRPAPEILRWLASVLAPQ